MLAYQKPITVTFDLSVIVREAPSLGGVDQHKAMAIFRKNNKLVFEIKSGSFSTPEAAQESLQSKINALLE